MPKSAKRTAALAGRLNAYGNTILPLSEFFDRLTDTEREGMETAANASAAAAALRTLILTHQYVVVGSNTEDAERTKTSDMLDAAIQAGWLASERKATLLAA